MERFEQFVCQKCTHPYNFGERRLMLLSCSHFICLKCTEEEPEQNSISCAKCSSVQTCVPMSQSTSISILKMLIPFCSVHRDQQAIAVNLESYATYCIQCKDANSEPIVIPELKEDAYNKLKSLLDNELPSYLKKKTVTNLNNNNLNKILKNIREILCYCSDKLVCFNHPHAHISTFSGKCEPLCDLCRTEDSKDALLPDIDEIVMDDILTRTYKLEDENLPKPFWRQTKKKEFNMKVLVLAKALWKKQKQISFDSCCPSCLKKFTHTTRYPIKISCGNFCFLTICKECSYESNIKCYPHKRKMEVEDFTYFHFDPLPYCSGCKLMLDLQVNSPFYKLDCSHVLCRLCRNEQCPECQWVSPKPREHKALTRFLEFIHLQCQEHQKTAFYYRNRRAICENCEDRHKGINLYLSFKEFDEDRRQLFDRLADELTKNNLELPVLLEEEIAELDFYPLKKRLLLLNALEMVIHKTGPIPSEVHFSRRFSKIIPSNYESFKVWITDKKKKEAVVLIVNHPILLCGLLVAGKVLDGSVPVLNEIYIKDEQTPILETTHRYLLTDLENNIMFNNALFLWPNKHYTLELTFGDHSYMANGDPKTRLVNIRENDIIFQYRYASQDPRRSNARNDIGGPILGVIFTPIK